MVLYVDNEKLPLVELTKNSTNFESISDRQTANFFRTMSMPPGILVNNVDFHYATNHVVVPVFDGLSITIHPGKIDCIMGSSGCGKSTFLDILAGFKPPIKGVIKYTPSKNPLAIPRLGYVFQSPSLLPWYTLKRNLEIAYFLSHPQVQKGSEIDKVSFWLESTGLCSFENAYPNQLSLGMQQRAALSMTMIAEPEIVLLDEPFGSLDALTREIMDLILLNTWEVSSPTMVLVTHSIEEAVFVGDHIYLLKKKPSSVLREWTVNISRPRNPLSIRSETVFLRLVRDIRQALYKESGYEVD
jgi:NitT/TauT family transport system ATP-binding protein